MSVRMVFPFESFLVSPIGTVAECYRLLVLGQCVGAKLLEIQDPAYEYVTPLDQPLLIV